MMMMIMVVVNGVTKEGVDLFEEKRLKGYIMLNFKYLWVCLLILMNFKKKMNEEEGRR